MADPVTRTELDAKLDALRSDTRASVVELRGEMREGFAKMEASFALLRTDIAKSATTVATERNEYTKWLLGITLTTTSVLIIGLAGVGISLYNAFKPVAQPQPVSAAAMAPDPAASR